MRITAQRHGIGLLSIALAALACSGQEARCVGSDCLPGEPCTSDAECDDGLVCTGAEICGTVSHRCVSGVPLACDDGVDCTVDRCHEPDGSCTSEPSSSLCPAGQECTGIDGTGCITTCAGGVTCDPVLACGCAPDDACRYGPTGSPSCGVAGTLEHGAACTRAVDCVVGAQCIARDGGDTLPAGFAECRALCHSDADCPGSGGCDIDLPITTTRACSRGCDLVSQDGCDGSARCHPMDWPGSNAYADCVVLGTLPAGAPCGNPGQDCAAGLICVMQTAGGGLCDRICLDNSDCTGGRRCLHLVEPLVVDGVEYGICN